MRGFSSDKQREFPNQRMIELSQLSDRTKRIAAYLLVSMSVMLAYHRTIDFPFHFDGLNQIAGRSSFHQLTWSDMPYTCRSLVSLIFQVEYQLFGLWTVPYHATNILLHIGSSLLLLGISIASLRSLGLPKFYRDNAIVIAAAIALIWSLHPLQTQAITYIVQRYESAMGFFVLLCLACFVRSSDSPRGWLWQIASVVAAYLALLCKEVAVVLPLLVLWYDRAWIAAGWMSILNKRWAYYLGLLSCWLLLLPTFVFTNAPIGGTSAVVVHEVVVVEGKRELVQVTPLHYLYSQANAIPFYVRLFIWPEGQSIDHAWRATRQFSQAAAPGLIVLLGFGLTIWSIFKAPKLSFLGGWFYLILAPTSSILPILDIVVEHRMYLPSISLATLLVIAFVEVLRLTGTEKPSREVSWNATSALLIFGLLMASLFGFATIQRNEMYRSGIVLWTDAVSKNPHNARAYHALGHAYVLEDRWSEAVPFLQQTLKVDPNYSLPSYFRDEMLRGAANAIKQGNREQALYCIDLAIEFGPPHAKTYVMQGDVLSEVQTDRAAQAYRRAIRIDPNNAAARQGLDRLQN